MSCFYVFKYYDEVFKFENLFSRDNNDENI